MPAPDLPSYAAQVRHPVQQPSDIPVCVGIASTKALAKLANRLTSRQGTTGAAGKRVITAWAGLSAHRLPRYTSGWDELWELR